MGHSVGTEDNKSRAVTTKAAMFFALIIVGLLIATANFIQVMGHSEGHGDAHGTEAGHEAHGAGAGHDAHAAPAHGNEHTAPAAHKEDTDVTAEEGKAGANADTTHAEAVHGKGAEPAKH